MRSDSLTWQHVAADRPYSAAAALIRVQLMPYSGAVNSTGAQESTARRPVPSVHILSYEANRKVHLVLQAEQARAQPRYTLAELAS